jgi:hypothetical protein
MTRSLLASFLLVALTAVPALAQDASGTATDTGSSPPDSGSTGTTGSAGSRSTSDVATEHGATHTSSSTTTRSGSAPARSADASQAPVIDPVTAPAAGTAAAPEEEEEEGDGRDYDVLWIEVQGGVSYANLIQFQNQNFADVAGGASVFNEVYGTGPAVGLGVGFRVWWLAIGARASVAVYEAFQIGTIGGEATLRLPIPVVEPWVRVGFGYGWQGDAQYQSGSSTYSTTTYGWVFQSGLGLDIYLTNWFTLGAGVGLDILNLTRQRDPSAMCMGATDVCPSRNGDALGYQLKGLATIGFHF